MELDIQVARSICWAFVSSQHSLTLVVNAMIFLVRVYTKSRHFYAHKNTLLCVCLT